MPARPVKYNLKPLIRMEKCTAYIEIAARGEVAREYQHRRIGAADQLHRLVATQEWRQVENNDVWRDRLFQELDAVSQFRMPGNPDFTGARPHEVETDTCSVDNEMFAAIRAAFGGGTQIEEVRRGGCLITGVDQRDDAGGQTGKTKRQVQRCHRGPRLRRWCRNRKDVRGGPELVVYNLIAQYVVGACDTVIRAEGNDPALLQIGR